MLLGYVGGGRLIAGKSWDPTRILGLGSYVKLVKPNSLHFRGLNASVYNRLHNLSTDVL